MKYHFGKGIFLGFIAGAITVLALNKVDYSYGISQTPNGYEVMVNGTPYGGEFSTKPFDKSFNEILSQEELEFIRETLRRESNIDPEKEGITQLEIKVRK